jgi:hypothetical protein
VIWRRQCFDRAASDMLVSNHGRTVVQIKPNIGGGNARYAYADM